MPKKGYKQTEGHRKKLCESHKGKFNSGNFRKGDISWNKGLTKETDVRVKKMSESNKGRHEHTKGTSNGFYGREHTEETKEKDRIQRNKIILPKKDTKIEVKIQNFLKQLGIEFFTHQYMKEIKHGYQCDVLIPSMNLVIECDGNYWHKYPIGLERDHIRTKELIEQGFKVLRLWEVEINEMTIKDFQERLYETKTTQNRLMLDNREIFQDYAYEENKKHDKKGRQWLERL